jgi:hypothetical protein
MDRASARMGAGVPSSAPAPSSHVLVVRGFPDCDTPASTLRTSSAGCELPGAETLSWEGRPLGASPTPSTRPLQRELTLHWRCWGKGAGGRGCLTSSCRARASGADKRGWEKNWESLQITVIGWHWALQCELAFLILMRRSI